MQVEVEIACNVRDTNLSSFPLFCYNETCCIGYYFYYSISRLFSLFDIRIQWKRDASWSRYCLQCLRYQFVLFSFVLLQWNLLHKFLYFILIWFCVRFSFLASLSCEKWEMYLYQAPNKESLSSPTSSVHAFNFQASKKKSVHRRQKQWSTTKICWLRCGNLFTYFCISSNLF